MQETFQPKKFGKYVLSKQLATGGMAEVYRARAFGEESFEKLCAIKMLHSHLSNTPSFVRMFTNEAKLAVTLNHVNVVPVFDFGNEDDFYYIAMEYVSGCDLAQLIKVCAERDIKIPLGLSIWILIEICNGLDYAHRKHDDLGNFLQLIHRDITPQNILLSHEGEVKIADFGIAKVQALGHDETTAGTLKGKFGYMSPEQVRGDSMDHRSDLFSLGVVSWELLTGEKLFDASNDYLILEQIREANYKPLGETKPGLPIELDDILSKALSRYPKDRYASIAEFRLALLRFLSSTQLFPSRAHLAAFIRKVFKEELALTKKRISEETETAREIFQKESSEIKPPTLIPNLPGAGVVEPILGGPPAFAINTGNFESFPVFSPGPMQPTFAPAMQMAEEEDDDATIPDISATNYVGTRASKAVSASYGAPADAGAAQARPRISGARKPASRRKHLPLLMGVLTFLIGVVINILLFSWYLSRQKQENLPLPPKDDQAPAKRSSLSPENSPFAKRLLTQVTKKKLDKGTAGWTVYSRRKGFRARSWATLPKRMASLPLHRPAS